MTITRLAQKCQECSKVNSCGHKRMEMCALAELPTKMCTDAGRTVSVSASAPILRERIESQLSPFTYRDEIEKALNEAHFGNRFMMFGA